MNFNFTFRFLAALYISSMSITANAQLQLICPLDWSALASIDGPNLDKIIYGVKAIVAKHEPEKIPIRDDELAQQALRNRQVDFERQVERDKYENLSIFIALIAAAVGGLIWNNFIRNRCPDCTSTSFDNVSETQADRWRGIKKVYEINSRGIKTRHIQTTFVTMQFEYLCKHCQHEWMKQRNEKLGAGSISRFFSGY